MKKLYLLLISTIIIGLSGCASTTENANAVPSTTEIVETLLESTTRTSEESESSTIATETELETTTTEPETTQFVPDFKDLTLALDCKSQIDFPNSLESISFESAQPEIVSVNEDGLLTALAVGTTDISVVIDEGDTYTFEVVVTTPEISTTTITKIVGNTEQISFYGTNGVPTFKSDNTAIATVTDRGLVTAEPTGAGQSTKIHAIIDGKEFVVDVNVEPVPQLLSTYQIYGCSYNRSYHDTETQKDYKYDSASIDLTGNANEIIRMVPTNDNSGFYEKTETVLDIGSVDYSSGDVYPLYRAFADDKRKKTHDCTKVYLVGSSQEASVVVKFLDGTNDLSSQVKYTACDGYGVIEVNYRSELRPVLISVLIDGYTYQFAIDKMMYGKFNYNPNLETEIDSNFVVSNCSVNGVTVMESDSYSDIRSNSSTFYGSKLASEIGGKIVEAAEDEAISFAVGLVFKLIF